MTPDLRLADNMKLSLKNNHSSLTIESLDSTKYTCDTCPDGIESIAIGVLYWDDTYNFTSTVFEASTENIEIKFCVNCKEIIRAFFNNFN